MKASQFGRSAAVLTIGALALTACGSDNATGETASGETAAGGPVSRAR